MPDIICTNGALSKEAILDYGSKGVLIPLGDMLNDPEIAPNFNSVVSEEDRQIMLKGLPAQTATFTPCPSTSRRHGT